MVCERVLTGAWSGCWWGLSAKWESGALDAARGVFLLACGIGAASRSEAAVDVLGHTRSDSADLRGGVGCLHGRGRCARRGSPELRPTVSNGSVGGGHGRASKRGDPVSFVWKENADMPLGVMLAVCLL